jgi:hypothetical protein
MITRKLKASTERNLAEKCDKALEKSWGTKVPKPDCLSKKHRKASAIAKMR